MTPARPMSTSVSVPSQLRNVTFLDTLWLVAESARNIVGHHEDCTLRLMTDLEEFTRQLCRMGLEVADTTMTRGARWFMFPYKLTMSRLYGLR